MMEEFKAHIKQKNTKWIYQKYLLGHDVWYFREYLNIPAHANAYDDLKIFLSEKLDVHVNNIAIVGSAKLGYSITPSKNKLFKPFSDKSDIDIAIVSPEIFRQSWNAFIELSKKGYLHDYQNITSNIFRRFVMLKKPDHRSEFFRYWSGKIDPCKKDLQTVFSIANDINYRIYESWEAIESYHCNGIEKLKNQFEELI